LKYCITKISITNRNEQRKMILRSRFIACVSAGFLFTEGENHMLAFYRPTESEIMDEARQLLRRRMDQLGPAPRPAVVPPAAEPVRRVRSLRTCHRFRLDEPARQRVTHGSGAYVPEMAARLDNDPNLNDGARRCGRKLVEVTYRRNRQGRSLPVTVSYLARGLGRCRRTVQRYLRLLEREGYVQVDVVKGGRSRLCIGLVVQLLSSLFAPHHRQAWPESGRNPGATRESQNNRFQTSIKSSRVRIPREQWALRCMDGVFRALMATIPPVRWCPG